MSEKKSSPVVILLAWLVVAAPAAWGVYNVGKQAAKLFQSPAPAAAPAASSTSTPATQPH